MMPNNVERLSHDIMLQVAEIDRAREFGSVKSELTVI